MRNVLSKPFPLLWERRMGMFLNSEMGWKAFVYADFTSPVSHV